MLDALPTGRSCSSTSSSSPARRAARAGLLGGEAAQSRPQSGSGATSSAPRRRIRRRDTLFVAYYASAELGCHRALGWPMPARILDLFTEFRDRTNGLATPAGAGLLGALAYFGLDAMGAAEKDDMRDADPARRAVVASRRRNRNPRLLPGRTSTRWRGCCPPCCRGSTYRARSCAAATWPPRRPWSTTACRSTSRCSNLLREHWAGIQDDLIGEIDAYGVYDGRTFKADRWARCLPATAFPGRGWKAGSWT